MGKWSHNPKNTVFSFRADDALTKEIEKAASRRKDTATFLTEAAAFYAALVNSEEEPSNASI